MNLLKWILIGVSIEIINIVKIINFYSNSEKVDMLLKLDECRQNSCKAEILYIQWYQKTVYQRKLLKILNNCRKLFNGRHPDRSIITNNKSIGKNNF